MNESCVKLPGLKRQQPDADHRRAGNGYHRAAEGMQIMAEAAPLRNRHEEYARSLRAWSRTQVDAGAATVEVGMDAAVEYLQYGISDAGEAVVTEIVATWGPVEAEYAAIRRGAGLVDRAQRGVIRVRGADRVEFLNRMLTQELKNAQPGSVRQSFWLSRSGRIEADMVLVFAADEVFIDLDHAQVAHVVEALSSYVFTEDVEISSAERQFARLALHGSRAVEVLGAAAGQPVLVPQFGSVSASFAGVDTILARIDETGDPGFELFVPGGSAVSVWDAILSVDEQLFEGSRRVRPIGWYAYNIARLEAGTPLFNVDFGPTNLPAESGVLDSRVSFTKGCYLGQEIVARMHSRGQCKQRVSGLLMEGEVLPVAGARVYAKDDPTANPVGVITSSTLSPMLGAKAIALAMVRASAVKEGGTELMAHAEGRPVDARVCALPFWSRKVDA